MTVSFLHRASWLKRSVSVLFLCSSACLLASCDIQPPKYKTPVDMASEMMSNSVIENTKQQKLTDSKKIATPIKIALMPKPGKSDTAHNALYNKQFNLVVNNIDAQLFFHNLSKTTPFNIIVDPKITGTISLDLKSVTVPQIFETLKDLYGYDYISTSSGFEVMSPQLKTAIFRVNYLDAKRVVDSKTSLASSDLVDAGSTTSSVNSSSSTAATPATRSSDVTNSVETTSTIAFWDNLSDSLKTLVGTDDGRTVTINANSGVVVVKAFPNELRRVREFIDRMQSSVNRQVVLEVSIMEVQLNDSFQAGINWKLLGLETTMGAVGVAGVTPFTTITMTDGNNESVMSLLKQQGNVQVLSSPRVLTVNNQQAVIKVGSENYYVTGITTTPSTSATSTTTSTTTMSSTVNLTPFFSGITLNITPQIDYNQQVMLHVHPTVTVVKQEDKTIDMGNGQTMVLPTASETLREYDSIVRASNNQLIVIGGMITNSISEALGSLPGVGSVPFLGSLFRFNTQISGKVELVIVLKPIAINEFPGSIVKELKESQQRMGDMDRGFHQGSMVDILGNEGEMD